MGTSQIVVIAVNSDWATDIIAHEKGDISTEEADAITARAEEAVEKARAANEQAEADREEQILQEGIDQLVPPISSEGK